MEVFTGEETDRPRCLNEYEKLVIRMNNTPRVVIDNAVCPTATLVKIDSARKHGILLEAVQLLTDLRLSINKAYISSDGRWFMDVFHVTDHLGRKLTDDSLISVIEQSLGDCELQRRSNVDDGLTALELTGADRPGLLSEVFAVLADLKCGVEDAKTWTHNGRMGSLIIIYDDDDENSGSPIDDPHKIRAIESRLRHVLDPHDPSAAGIAISSAAVARGDRRLHQMMFADRDYEPASASPPSVSVQKWVERGYSVVGVQCRDRPKLLFDVVCTLTDMRYIVFHGTVDTDGDRARQEFYIRHKDGSPISSQAEKQRVIKCLQAAIDRRSSEGMRLELRVANRPGLLADVTRTFRENGLLVRRAEVSTKDQSAYNVFYVTDAGGQPVDPKTIDAVRLRIGEDCLQVVAQEEQPPLANRKPAGGWEDGPTGRIGLFYLGSLVMRNLYNLGIIRSCS